MWFWERESIYEMPSLQKPPENVWEVLKYAIWKQLSKGHSGVPKTIWGKVSLLGWVSASYIIMLLLSSSVISFMTASVRDYRGSITSIAQLENEPTVSIEDRIQTIMAQEQAQPMQIFMDYKNPSHQPLPQCHLLPPQTR